MFKGPVRPETMRGVLLIAAFFLVLVSFRPSPMGVRLAVEDGGVSFLLKASTVKIAFDIGQACSKTDSCSGLIR